jgi:hypothetical protein
MLEVGQRIIDTFVPRLVTVKRNMSETTVGA